MEKKKKDRLAEGIAGWLQRKAVKVPVGIQKLLFFTVVFIVAVYCALLIGGLGQNDIKLTRITVPMVSGTDGDRISERINKLKGHIDSLSRSEPGRQELDRLLHNNPGLMDSIRVWEERIKGLSSHNGRD